MILYFADRRMNILGIAGTELPEGFAIVEDTKTEDVETGVAVLECTLAFDVKSREIAEKCTEVGNYLLCSYHGENRFFTIIENESDTKSREISVYAEDAGLDLLNEICVAYEADRDYPIAHYIEKFAYDSGFVIGVNEASGLSRKLSWDGESTAAERIASVATQFDNCEVSYSFEIKGLQVIKKYINIYKKCGAETGVQLRLNKEVDKIVSKKSIANLATALKVTGGTPEEEENPIDLNGYSYDDGDIFLEGTYLKSRSAVAIWSRYLAETGNYTGHIMRTYTYDTTSQSELCNRAVSELKKVSQIEVNYEADVSELPDSVRVGDRVSIVDEAGKLYLSTRILKLEESATGQTRKVTFGEFLMKDGGIHEDVERLATQFSKSSHSAAHALTVAKEAKTQAINAQTEASGAVTEAENANRTAEEAKTAADYASSSAAEAQTKADNAVAAVNEVEEDVASIEKTVEDANATANRANEAAATAETKANEAQEAAAEAKEQAAAAENSASTAKEQSATAITKAEEAQTIAGNAKSEASEAKATADAAKLDAEQAEKDVAAFGESLDSLSNTMQADYARKSDLTETETKLQTQISQNAAEIQSTATQVTKIDETANNAAEKASKAQTTAEAAQAKADQSVLDAAAAQQAADDAALAASNAQNEADRAKTAAANAQSVADKAEDDLAAALADLATVQERVDATEEDIAAAQQAVETAQAAADKAKADAQSAADKATAAQNTADSAVTDAANAQTAADNAETAQDMANEAQNAAENAQADATAAKKAADDAQNAVDALAIRVTTAETKISQTAEQIKLLATTEEVSETLGGYYTKEEADAAIELSADNVKITVANTYATKTALSLTDTKATNAATAAANAQQAADEAAAKAQSAATDLATAEQNLADVTSRVDVTEGEISAAREAVIIAQARAEEANNAAANAQAAADAAQDDVDALAIRVTDTETAVEQNAKDITLRATKKEWNTVSAAAANAQSIADSAQEAAESIAIDLDANYYTKTEADAKIKIEADRITSVVGTVNSQGTKINTLEQTSEGLTVRLDLVETTADDAAKTATNYLSYDSTNGLQIGNKENGTWSGYRTRISSSSFDILDSSGNEVASYGASVIYLGKNNENAIISFCNENATISYGSELGASFKGASVSLETEKNSEGSYSYINLFCDSPDPLGEYNQICMRANYKNSSFTDWFYSEVVVDPYFVNIIGKETVNLIAPETRVSESLTVGGNLTINDFGLFATAGETLICGTCDCGGDVTADTTTIYFNVPLPKILNKEHNALTVTFLKANIRKVGGGYIGGSSSFVSDGGYDYYSDSNYTVGIDTYSSPFSVRVFIRNDVSTFDTTNNTPVSVVCYTKFMVR